MVVNYEILLEDLENDSMYKSVMRRAAAANWKSPHFEPPRRGRPSKKRERNSQGSTGKDKKRKSEAVNDDEVERLNEIEEAFEERKLEREGYVWSMAHHELALSMTGSVVVLSPDESTGSDNVNYRNKTQQDQVIPELNLEGMVMSSSKYDKSGIGCLVNELRCLENMNMAHSASASSEFAEINNLIAQSKKAYEPIIESTYKENNGRNVVLRVEGAVEHSSSLGCKHHHPINGRSCSFSDVSPLTHSVGENQGRKLTERKRGINIKTDNIAPLYTISLMPSAGSDVLNTRGWKTSECASSLTNSYDESISNHGSDTENHAALARKGGLFLHHTMAPLQSNRYDKKKKKVTMPSFVSCSKTSVMTLGEALCTTEQPRLIVEIKAPQRIIHVNAAMHALSGYESSEMLDKAISSFVCIGKEEDAATNLFRLVTTIEKCDRSLHLIPKELNLLGLSGITQHNVCVSLVVSGRFNRKETLLTNLDEVENVGATHFVLEFQTGNLIKQDNNSEDLFAALDKVYESFSDGEDSFGSLTSFNERVQLLVG